jgi:NAD(P)-dependent dehydrogenase (short-subunit alcohol dehydrogenase family)
VAQPDDCREVARAAAEFGPGHVLVNNAGVASAVPASRETPEQFLGVMDVNLNGAYWMAQAAAAVMANGGSIVNVSSVLGLVSGGLPQAAYSASKAGLLGLTRDLAQQWTGRKGIRVNALAPGYFASEMTDQYPEGYLKRTSPGCRWAAWATRRSWPRPSSSSRRRRAATPPARRSWSTAA